MWALNLLRFKFVYNGVRTTRNGFLQVFDDRLTEERIDRKAALSTIDPANIRFVDASRSFLSRVRASSWVFDSRKHGFVDLTDSERDANESLEKILTAAERGERPPFFDEEYYVKIEPGFAARTVQVIAFRGVNDLVVVDIGSRQLIAKRVQGLLSKKRWEPEITASK